MIQPIETEYNGYRFRSRTEARWAVFFDTLGIRYYYEEDGYDIEGTWYLPDFHLPEQECWFEVKPDAKSIDDNLYQIFSGQVGPLVVFTMPDINTEGAKFTLDDHDSNGGFTTGAVAWYFCPQHGFQLSLRCSYRCTVFTNGYYGATVKVCGTCDVDPIRTKHDFVHPRIVNAYKAARQARFEHR